MITIDRVDLYFILKRSTQRLTRYCSSWTTGIGLEIKDTHGNDEGIFHRRSGYIPHLPACTNGSAAFH